nr:hypothetical protein [Tanacetum cinerariifolium]
DSLTISINYEPVVAVKQTNRIAGTKDNIVASQAKKKKELEQEYILILIYTTDPLNSQVLKDSKVDAAKKATEVDASRVLDNGGQDDQVTISEFKGLLQQERQTKHINSTNSFNTIVLPINIVGPSFANTALPLQINVDGTPASTNAFKEHPFKQFSPFKNAFSLPHVLIVTLINDTGIFGNAYDDEAVEEEVNMNNVVSSYTIPDAPITKFFKDCPKDQVIGSIETCVQTRQMTKINEEHDWLFDIDSLTISINYEPVVAVKQTNRIAGTKDNIVASQAKKKKELEQEYILILIYTTDPLNSQVLKDSEVDAAKKATKVDASRVLDNGGQDDQVTRS